MRIRLLISISILFLTIIPGGIFAQTFSIKQKLKLPGVFRVSPMGKGPQLVAIEYSAGQFRYMGPTERGALNGIQAEYFNDIELRSSVLKRTESVIDNDYGYDSPDSKVQKDNFSARWTMKVKVDSSEDYTFSVVTDDGMRLWVNNQLMIDSWRGQGPTEYNTKPIPLVAGSTVDLRIEYYESGGPGTAKLFWKSPSHPKSLLRSIGTISVSEESVTVSSAPYSVKGADVDGDKRDDIVIAHAGFPGMLSVIRRTANGNVSDSLEVGDDPIDLCLVDIDGDKDLDVVTGNRASKDLSVLKNDGSGKFDFADSIAIHSPVSALACEDFNSDGKVDIAVLSQKSNEVRILLNQGKGIYSEAQKLLRKTMGGLMIPIDANGDGNMDLVVTDGSMYVTLLNQKGVFSESAIVDVESEISALSSISLDSKSKGIAILTKNGFLQILRFVGNKSQLVQKLETGEQDGSGMIGLDVDKDGDEDIVFVSQKSSQIILVGRDR